jgi:hypothetical protein
MQFNLTPEDIDSLVRDSIMKNGFGNAVTTAITKVLNTGYNNPIDEQIKILVGRITADLINEKFKDQIKVLVADQIEKQVTQDLLEKVTYETTKKMVDSVDRW